MSKANRLLSKLLGMIPALLLCLGLLAGFACEREGPVESAGERAGETVEEAGEAAEKAGEEAKEGVEEAGEKAAGQ